jgi:tetratricopeptide (TPR) repeat protein
MPRQRGSGDPPAPRDRLARALKWVGAGTSILSLIFGLYQLTNLMAGVRERQRRIAESLDLETSQRTAGDFARAWATLQEAAKLADEGGKLATIMGRLDEVRGRVRLRQEDLGMAWLRDARPGPGKAFSDIVNPVLPILERGLLTATGERKADLLAHLGWADFLRSRDDGVVRNPDTRYREAVQLDARNPYAHAKLGHWILWRNGTLEAAKKEFSAALESGRAHEYVRRMQISALQNRPSDEADAEILRVVNDMRKNKEPVDERTRSRVLSIYSSAFGGDEATAQKLLTAVPPIDQLETFQALFYDQDFDPSKRPSREVCLATLQEASGRPEDALRTLQSVRSGLPSNASGGLTRVIDASIARLSRRPGQPSKTR